MLFSLSNKLKSFSSFFKLKMPFCTYCGTFNGITMPNSLCTKCFTLILDKKLSINDIEKQKETDSHSINMMMLAYLKDIFEVKSKNTNSFTPDITEAPALPGFIAVPPRNQQHPTTRYIRRGQNIQRSTIALILMLFGLFMPLIVGLPLEILALFISIKAKAVEPPNYRQKIAYYGSVIIILLLILGIVVVLMYPDDYMYLIFPE
jgi:hypothetical protein